MPIGQLPGAKLPGGKATLAAFEFGNGTLVLTESGTQRRASLHLAADRAALAALNPGGEELDALDAAGFAALLRRENHTLKRALTDPQLLSGIGNAYSDEILHRARLSPLALTQSQDDATLARLFDAARAVMAEYCARCQTGGRLLADRALSRLLKASWPKTVDGL